MAALDSSLRDRLAVLAASKSPTPLRVMLTLGVKGTDYFNISGQANLEALATWLAPIELPVPGPISPVSLRVGKLCKVTCSPTIRGLARYLFTRLLIVDNAPRELYNSPAARTTKIEEIERLIMWSLLNEVL